MTQKEEYSHLNALNILGINERFRTCCVGRNLEEIKYLLTSPNLKQNADIHYDNDAGFIWACYRGYTDIIEYLLTNPDLIEHSNIQEVDNEGIRLACREGHLETVDFLLTSPCLKEYPDIHAKNDDAFIESVKNNHLDIVNYLIYNFEIEKTDNIVKFINDKPDIVKLFELRELNQTLNTNLKTNKIQNNKLRI